MPRRTINDGDLPKNADDCLAGRSHTKKGVAVGDAFYGNDRVYKNRAKAIKSAREGNRIRESIKEVEELKASMDLKGIIPDIAEKPNEMQDNKEIIWQPLTKGNQWHEKGPQIEFLEADEEEVLFSGGRGPLAYGSKVLTPNGFKNIENLKIGSKIITPDNKTAFVIDIPFDGEGECVELEFIDGRKVICDYHHLWPVVFDNSSIDKYVIRITSELVKDFYDLDKSLYFFSSKKGTIETTELVNITPVGKRKVRCITISDPNSLFITNDYIVTRNSGKSSCLLADPFRYTYNKNFRALIIRRTMPELKELISRAKDLYLRLDPNAKWKEQEKHFVFSSGSTIEFGYCDHKDDLERYRGQQYTWLGIDEITQFPEDWNIIDILSASLRTTDPNLRIFIRATTNPSGVGVHWVKKRWVDLVPPGKTYTKEFTGYGGQQVILRRKWIQSIPEDNEILMKNDPLYLAKLQNIENEHLREQWLYGSWESVEGLAFSEFRRDIHVCKPFNIPRNWKKWRAADWGYSGGLAVCLWFAMDYDKNIYIYREFTCNGNKTAPNERLRADAFALKVLELERYDGVTYGILDSSVWNTRGEVGETPADTMLKMGCRWIPADRSKGSRISGKMLIHDYLTLDLETQQPKLKIFDNCTQLIKELGSLVLDPNNLEDVETKNQDDHAYDALRYGLGESGSSPFPIHSMNNFYDAPVIINQEIGI